jgi:hypothetical protein
MTFTRKLWLRNFTLGALVTLAAWWLVAGCSTGPPAVTHIPGATTQRRFAVECPQCKVQRVCVAFGVLNTAGHAVDGGSRSSLTLDLACPDCGKRFAGVADEFVPAPPHAVEVR